MHSSRQFACVLIVILSRECRVDIPRSAKHFQFRFHGSCRSVCSICSFPEIHASEMRKRFNAQIVFDIRSDFAGGIVRRIPACTVCNADKIGESFASSLIWDTNFPARRRFSWAETLPAKTRRVFFETTRTDTYRFSFKKRTPRLSAYGGSGATDGNRTRYEVLPPRDFKSLASADFIQQPLGT